MFGKVHTYVLLAAVILSALIRVEETVQYSPWCCCRVSAHFTVLLPRSAPSKRHRKYDNRRLYIVLLLLLLAGDVELSPGPPAVENNVTENSATVARQRENDSAEATCSQCSMTFESLKLRSRAIADAAVKCVAPDCDRFAHHHCTEAKTNDPQTEWTCADHANIDGGCQTHDRHPPPPPVVAADDIPARAPSEPPPVAAAVDTPSPPVRVEASPEPIPGPSFASVTLMDVMEALRLTQLKTDKVADDLQEIKHVFQTHILLQDDHKQTPAQGRDSVPQYGDVGAVSGKQGNNTATTCLQRTSERDLLIVGDSNVRRLELSNSRPNISFRSGSGATTQQLERDLRTSDKLLAPRVILHVGTLAAAGGGGGGTGATAPPLAQKGGAILYFGPTFGGKQGFKIS